LQGQNRPVVELTCFRGKNVGTGSGR